MAGFPYQHHSFLLDSVILPSTPIKIPGSWTSEDTSTTCFSYLPSEPLNEVPIDAGLPKESYLDNSKQISPCDNEPSMALKWNLDSSSVGIEPKSGDHVTQDMTQMDKKRKKRNAPCLISAQSKDASEGEVKRQKKFESTLKDSEKKKLKAATKNEKKVAKGVPRLPTEYVHVRARRSQATDSHSLEERVRREKINVRMKLLQDLVPGCDKVISKAHMLDETINYVQSLQSQVEFLSMKLAYSHPMFHDYGEDSGGFMKLRSRASPSLSLQVSIPSQPTVSVDDTTTLTTKSNYPTMDSSVFRLVQQEQRPDAFCQDNKNPIWGAEDQLQRFINQSGFNNFSSFH